MPFPPPSWSLITQYLRHLFPVILTGFLVLVAPANAGAQTKTKKKSASPEATGKSTTKKKTPKSQEESGIDPADGLKPKPRTASPATAPAPVKKLTTDVEPEQVPSLKPAAAPNAAITSSDLIEFHAQPAGIQKLIESSLELARQNLTYSYGSADPASGGMDCSGFIYYLLRQHGLTQVPRDSSGLYSWIRRSHGFRAVISRQPDSFEMDELLPGDLLFWIGTYATDHDPPVTHTMLYLGTEKSSGAKVMIGSSDGRTYRGLKRNGVSVFDFSMPRTPVASDPRSTFIGYARIPGLRD